MQPASYVGDISRICRVELAADATTQTYRSQNSPLMGKMEVIHSRQATNNQKHHLAVVCPRLLQIQANPIGRSWLPSGTACSEAA